MTALDNALPRYNKHPVFISAVNLAAGCKELMLRHLTCLLIDDDNSPKSHQQLEDKMNSLGNSYTYQAVNVGGDKMNCQGFCFHMCAFATNKSIVEASAKIASLMGNVLF